LYTRIGALYVALVSQEEKNNELTDELVEQQKQYARVSQRFGNALAHLEVHDKETYDRIMAGEQVDVIIDKEMKVRSARKEDFEPPPAGPIIGGTP
jgi:uncharacterized coiled-coil protein SlyX